MRRNHTDMSLRILAAIPLCVSWSLAQDLAPAKVEPAPDPQPAAVAGKPSVTQLDDARYQIGGVIFNRLNREIRFPAKMNMSEGLIEYVVVLQKGHVHEAFLLADISPTDLNLAFTLLRYKPSPELFSEIEESGHPSGILPEVPLPVKASARIAIEVEWTHSGTTHRCTLNEWFQSRSSQTTMIPGPWLYTGSSSSEGVYIPELSGDVISVKPDRYAVVNYPGTDNVDQPSWYPSLQLVPPVGTDVTVIISPFFKRKPLPTP